MRQLAVWLIGLLLCLLWLVNMVGLTRFGSDYGGLISNIKTNDTDAKYRRTMAWATGLDETGAENIPAGQRIYNTNWDKFPKMFFLDTKHTYVYGLDPNYLYSADPEKFKLLQDINDGKVDDPAPIIRDKFGANYIFTDAKENTDMIAKALESGWVETIYEDDEARLFKIRAVKGDAPDAAKDEAPATPEEQKILDEEERNDAKGKNVNLDDDDPDN